MLQENRGYQVYILSNIVVYIADQTLPAKLNQKE
jgi:hypothetical protein